MGGRDITIDDVKNMAKKGFRKLKGEKVSEFEWQKLDTDILPEGI